MKMLENESLSNHTTFRLGGEARYFCEAYNIEEIKEVLDFAKTKKISYFILGGGSNVVVHDKGYDGIVIKFQMSNLKCQKFGAPSAQIHIIEAEAGVSLAKVVSECENNGLVGMEWAWGIPGTVGGAVRGNAGAYGGEMKDSIQSVKVLRDGKIIELENEDCKFNYRESIFKKNKDIILSAKIKLKKGSDEELKNSLEKLEKIKRERGDKFSGGYSAGSFFKNILFSEREIKDFKNNFPELPDQFVDYKKIPAAWLIDQCGLKGFCIGDICISEKHAGIIFNKKNGSSDELHQLVSVIKQKVRDKFGIELIEEVVYLR